MIEKSLNSCYYLFKTFFTNTQPVRHYIDGDPSLPSVNSATANSPSLFVVSILDISQSFTLPSIILWILRWSKRRALLTSRTKHLDRRSVQFSVSSNKDATLKELYKLISQCPSQKLKNDFIIAGFIDNRSTPQQFAYELQCLLDITYMKLNHSDVIVAKTILQLINPKSTKSYFL